MRKGSLSPAAALGVNAEAKPAFGGGSPPRRAIQACRNVANDKGVAQGCYVVPAFQAERRRGRRGGSPSRVSDFKACPPGLRAGFRCRTNAELHRWEA